MSVTLFLICLATYLVLDRFASHADALAGSLILFAVVHLSAMVIGG
jgi:hypothetical protein